MLPLEDVATLPHDATPPLDIGTLSPDLGGRGSRAAIVAADGFKSGGQRGGRKWERPALSAEAVSE